MDLPEVEQSPRLGVCPKSVEGGSMVDGGCWGKIERERRSSQPLPMQRTRSNGDNLGLACVRTAVELLSERLRHAWQRRLERDLGRIPLYRLTLPQNPDKIGTHPFRWGRKRLVGLGKVILVGIACIDPQGYVFQIVNVNGILGKIESVFEVR